MGPVLWAERRVSSARRPSVTEPFDAGLARFSGAASSRRKSIEQHVSLNPAEGRETP